MATPRPPHLGSSPPLLRPTAPGALWTGDAALAASGEGRDSLPFDSHSTQNSSSRNETLCNYFNSVSLLSIS